jgi:hypothetical protein
VVTCAYWLLLGEEHNMKYTHSDRTPLFTVYCHHCFFFAIFDHSSYKKIKNYDIFCYNVFYH